MAINLQGIFKSVSKTMVKHSPEILTGLGIASIFGTAALAVAATPKAIAVKDLADEQVDHIESQDGPKEDIREIRKAMYIKMAKLYWKPAVTAAVGTTSLIFAHKIHTKRHLALASAYAITAKELSDFKEAARELKVLNKNNEQKINDHLVKKKVERAKSKNKEVIFTGQGEDYFVDNWSGQIFKSSTIAVEKAVNELNSKMLREDQVTLNDLYYLLGIPEVPAGDLGFEASHGMIEVVFGSSLIDGKAYITMEFDRLPRELW